jgi:hypothetical protein
MNRIKYFEQVVTRCELALKQEPNMIPLEWIIDQLQFLIGVEKGEINDLSKLNEIKIGWIAVREMDGFEDKDLIRSLCIVSNEVQLMITEKKLLNNTTKNKESK